MTNFTYVISTTVTKGDEIGGLSVYVVHPELNPVTNQCGQRDSTTRHGWIMVLVLLLTGMGPHSAVGKRARRIVALDLWDLMAWMAGCCGESVSGGVASLGAAATIDGRAVW